MKRIGNSLLPSSNPTILAPIKIGTAILQVMPDEKMDTHHLTLKRNDVETIIASHPNGFSCHSLAQRILAGDVQRITEQADYIIRCGGQSKSATDISALISIWQSEPLCYNKGIIWNYKPKSRKRPPLKWFTRTKEQRMVPSLPIPEPTLASWLLSIHHRPAKWASVKLSESNLFPRKSLHSNVGTKSLSP